MDETEKAIYLYIYKNEGETEHGCARTLREIAAAVYLSDVGDKVKRMISIGVLSTTKAGRKTFYKTDEVKK
jgi:hypothetical protein